MPARIGLSYLPPGRTGRNYLDAVAVAGGEPVALMSRGQPELAAPAEGVLAWLRSGPAAVERLRELDGLLLTGGADVDPAWYHEQPAGSEPPDRARDHLELAQLALAREAGLPILGICRGAQLLNVAFGGSLVQHLPSSPLHAAAELTGPSREHGVCVSAGSALAGILGLTAADQPVVAVNSRHHQAATLERLAPGLVATATSMADDAGLTVVEALETPATLAGEEFVLAVQWHPERLADPIGRAPGQREDWSSLSRRLFAAFVAAAEAQRACRRP